jgi:signal transduction histidine kinase
MMQHARGRSGKRQQIEINALVEEYINLAYQGWRTNQTDEATKDFTLLREYGENAGVVNLIPQDIGRVLVNLCTNAFDALQDKTTALNGSFEPTLRVTTQRDNQVVTIRVSDNGPGIPMDARDKIFEPFYTTKPTGRGTGLGLSLSFDIVTNGHNGALTVESEPGEGTSFALTLPI